jgi:hypothetical protein
MAASCRVVQAFNCIAGENQEEINFLSGRSRFNSGREHHSFLEPIVHQVYACVFTALFDTNLIPFVVQERLSGLDLSSIPLRPFMVAATNCSVVVPDNVVRVETVAAG